MTEPDHTVDRCAGRQADRQTGRHAPACIVYFLLPFSLLSYTDVQKK